MATKKKHKEMVFHKEWTNVPTKATMPPLPPSLVLLKPVMAAVGDEIIFTDKEEDGMKKSSAGNIAKESSPTKVIQENLPAKITCRGVSVSLDNNIMWNEFFRCQTEMIVTQDGSRMFPYCRFRISGLDASKKYSLFLDIQPVDSSLYEWTGHDWRVAGKAVRHVKSRPFSHPESPSTGQHWLEQPVSFYKLKLTNVPSQGNHVPGQGNIVLHPLHRYIPRLHVVPFENTKKELKLTGPRVVTFTFPQTEFFAVTAYQNSRFTQLKVNYNPFAKGLKDERSSSLALMLKSAASKDLNKEADPSNNQKPPVKKSLKSLLANHKPRSSTAADKHPDIPIPAATSSTEEHSSKAQPSQKLFSELIREAHVSLRRCNLDKMVASMKSTCTVKEADTEFEPPVPTVCIAVNEKSAMASCPAPKSPIKPSLALWNSESKTEPQPEENVRPHKRPALVPLPALARFLSKHQSKHRNVGTRQEPLITPPSEAPPPPKAAPGVRSPGGSHSGSYCISPLSTLHHQEPTREGQVFALQIVLPEPKVPDGAIVLPSTDLPLSTSEQIPSSTSTSAPEGLPTAIDTFLGDITDSSTVSGCASTNKPAPLLPDSSPIDFEPLSPASSPEPLPPLPVSLGLEISPPPSIIHTTLKWHSLFPQPDPFLTSFTPFHPTPQSPTLNSSTQPCPQAPSVAPDPLLHDDEYQSLSFPGELSPLALQLSLSPSFSSLDGGALSPTPSLSDLLSFISTDNNNLLLEAEVGKAELVPVPCAPLPLTVPVNRPDPCLQVQSEPELTTKPVKAKKKCRKGQSKGATSECDPVYTKMQPSLEEVEEQLFVSFTSKEALKLHLQDSPEGLGTQPLESSREDPQPTTPPPEKEPSQPSTPPPDTGGMVATATGDHVSPGEGLEDHEERVAVFQKVLLRDLKLMKNRQVIHPVLQEVGLKMHLLDSALAIDLQYLGVRLPIPPHPVSLEAKTAPPMAQPMQAPPLPSQSVCLDFVSRTGKTSDITQIKGWREKFSPSESSTLSSSSRPEAAASSEPPSKNLSAFCSDMLDEYLENEGKFLDQQASSFSQTPPEPMAYELPIQSSSYVRTLSSVLKKQPLSAPTSALISSFVPPSKRPRLPPMTTKKSKADRKQKITSSKLKSKPASGTGDSAPTDSSSALVSPTAASLEQPLTQPPTLTTSPAQTATPSTHLSPTETLPPPVLTLKDKTLKTKKPKSMPSPLPTPKTCVSEHLAPGCQDIAPLESDSELGPAGDEAPSQPPQPKALVSVTLLKQRDLENRVVLEGRPRTCITEERAAIALTSLFTTAGFVLEDPTAPIQLVKRRAPPCLKDFCRLGCICSSLAQARPLTHCGKVQCMMGCGCLRQKVVLLKNLDGSDSSPSDLDPSKRKRKKRMKMAYVLKETESVAQPSQPVRTLWKGRDVDPEPTYTPGSVTLPRNKVRRVARSNGKTCARVRGYMGRKTLNNTQRRSQNVSRKLRNQPIRSAARKPNQPITITGSVSDLSPSKSPESVPQLSKHLVIMADCRWPNSEVQTQVLKAVCQAMVQERLHTPFWINKYYAKLLSFSNKDGVIQYKVHISEGNTKPTKPRLSTTRPGQAGPTGTGGEKVEGEDAVEDWQKEVECEDAVEDWQKEVEGEEEAVEDWQKEVGGGAVEDWQKEVEEDNNDLEEDNEGLEEREKRMMKMGLPFLSGLSHAGFLTAKRRVSGEGNLLVQLNGKPYPTAMIQLGRMGALHPANRLAAYLTGRVGPSRPPGPPASDTTAVTMATISPTADHKGPGAGAPGVQALLPDTHGQLFKTMPGRLVQLVPVSQVRSLKVSDGTPGTHKDGKTIVSNALGPLKGVQALSVAPPSAMPAPSAGTCKLQLVSANYYSSMPLIITVPMLPPPKPAGSSGTDLNLRPAGSSGTDLNLRPAGSSGTDPNLRPAGSSGTDLNLRPAGSSGTDLNLRPAGSSGTDPNLRPAGSSGTDLNLRPAGSSGTDLNLRPAGSSGMDLNLRPARPSGTDLNLRPAGSSGTDLNLRPAGSSGMDLNLRPAGSSGMDLNLRPAGSSGTDLNLRPAGSSGMDLNLTPAGPSGKPLNIRDVAYSGTDLNIICVDNDYDIQMNEEHVDGSRTSKEKPSLVGLQRAGHDDAVIWLSSDSSYSSSDSEPGDGPPCSVGRRRVSGRDSPVRLF
ncbi:MAX gene-associated protein [Merluccius polli]|uniref:MAX gene-associated protein n=1 Tax=Merluccius polli TaxID=89951 RepID=A0AA47MIG1_MERPO|nr:MAX gene-associated protein [Merluccius polli]